MRFHLKFGMAFLILFLLYSSVSSSAQDPATHTIKITNNKFSISELKVDIGDKVIFEWDKDAAGHNVAQASSSKSLEYKSGGFRSGDPRSGSFTYEIPEEYLQTNITLYFLCIPHAISRMRGKIVVGIGSGDEEDAPGFLFIPLLMSFFVVSMIIKIKNSKQSIDRN